MYGPLQNMIFVTDEEARNYFIPPNSKVLLMSKDKPEFYVKSSDSLGQYTFDTYTFEKVQPQPQQPAVTQADFDAFKQDILALLTHPASTAIAQPQPQEVKNNDESTQQ